MVFSHQYKGQSVILVWKIHISPLCCRHILDIRFPYFWRCLLFLQEYVYSFLQFKLFSQLQNIVKYKVRYKHLIKFSCSLIFYLTLYQIKLCLQLGIGKYLIWRLLTWRIVYPIHYMISHTNLRTRIEIEKKYKNL